MESRDDRTQLLSRGECDSALEQGILEARQSEEPLSLVLGDIDDSRMSMIRMAIKPVMRFFAKSLPAS